MLSASDCLNDSGCSARRAPNLAWKCHARRVRNVSSASVSTGYAEDTAAPAEVKTEADDSMIEATSWSTSNAPPRSVDSATRRPESEPETGGAKVEPGSPS